jgi:hypothetical protein
MTGVKKIQFPDPTITGHCACYERYASIYFQKIMALQLLNLVCRKHLYLIPEEPSHEDLKTQIFTINLCTSETNAVNVTTDDGPERPKRV